MVNYTKEELNKKKVVELRKIARHDFDISKANDYSKEDLIATMLHKQEEMKKQAVREEAMNSIVEEVEIADDSAFEEQEPDEFDYEDYGESFKDSDFDENGEPVGEAKEKVEQMFQTDKADGVQPVKVEQLTLDVNQNQPEQPVQPKNVKIQEIRMTEEELQEQRRKSFEKLRGGADKGKKSKFQFDSSWISKPLGILALITMHVLIDNFIICVETVFYYLWYGDLLSIKEELITCSVCLAFFFILLITKGIPVACDGIMELFCDIKSTFINEEKN